MRHLLVAAIYISAFLLVAACSPESSSYVSERPLVDKKVDIPDYERISEQTFEWITEDGGQGQLDFNPQLDILFVTDNSESMKATQQNLFDNMDKFTRGITKNKMIDYHVGVISVWDSSAKYAAANVGKYGIGDLRFIKDSKQQYNRRFVIKTDAKNIVAETLKIGAVALKDGGPENEEMFSPLKAALEKTGRGDVNEEFFRSESQLIVIFLTDADDSSKNVTAADVWAKLLEVKGGRADKISVYGALVRPGDDDSKKDWALRIHPTYHPECFNKAITYAKNHPCKAGFGPDRIEQLILKANETAGLPQQIREKFIIGINGKQFGTELGKIGDSITAKTLAKEIFLSQRPRVDDQGRPMIKVSYGNQVIPQSKTAGWLYNPANNSIVLSGEISYEYVEGARFAVSLSPVNLTP